MFQQPTTTKTNTAILCSYGAELQGTSETTLKFMLEHFLVKSARFCPKGMMQAPILYALSKQLLEVT